MEVERPPLTALNIEEAPRTVVRSPSKEIDRHEGAGNRRRSTKDVLLHSFQTINEQIKEIGTPCFFASLLAMVVICGIIALCTHSHPSFFKTIYHTNIQSEADCISACVKVADANCEVCHGDKGPTDYCLRFKKKHDDDYERFSHHNMCSHKLLPPWWHPYVVIASLIFAVGMIVDGAPAEMVLLSANVIFVQLGILTQSEAYSGLGDKTVVALAMLFPIAAAIDETGVLELALSKFLGSPNSLMQAMMRLMVCVALLSAVLNNTTVVAAMIPAIVSWSRRIKISPSLLLMPLSFGAQLGGTCTLIGSSACIAAKTLTENIYGDPPMTMLSLTPLGVVLVMIVTGACIALSGLLPQPELPLDGQGESTKGTSAEDGEHYNVIAMIIPNDLLVGKCLEETGLRKLNGILSVTKETGDDQALMASEEISLVCTADGIVSLRRVRGMQLINNQEIAKLGCHRRRRRVFEAMIHTRAPLLERAFSTVTAAHFRHTYGGCILSMRRPGQGASIIWRRTGAEQLRAGDIIVFEADTSYAGSEEWSQNFSIVRELKGSTPARFGFPNDQRRVYLVCACMVVLIGLVTLSDVVEETPWHGLVKLDYGAGIMLVLLLVTKCITPQGAYQSIKPSVLLVIAGAMGMGKAMQNTGVAEFIATSVGAVAGKLGALGVFAAVYFIAVGLSMFINNTATIAIVAPMLDTLGTPLGISGRYLTWTLIYSAGSCFTTPLGYQTNLMVVPDGGYKFSDFMKFGGPVQLCHAFACILLCWGAMVLKI